MAATIYKYALPIADRATVSLPVGASILHIDEQQFGELAMWALVDPHATSSIKRDFRVFGTGHAIEDTSLEHLATVVSANGLVWHVEDVPF